MCCLVVKRDIFLDNSLRDAQGSLSLLQSQQKTAGPMVDSWLGGWWLVSLILAWPI